MFGLAVPRKGKEELRNVWQRRRRVGLGSVMEKRRFVPDRVVMATAKMSGVFMTWKL